MHIAHVKTFLEIYHLRHFGKVAEKLFITQSAASARIKQLEDQLDVQLFHRDKRGVTPTAAAHRFYKYAEVIVSGWEQARHLVALPDEFQQSLSIGSIADIWHLFLNDGFSELQSSHGDIALNLSILKSSEVADLLVNGVIDMALMFEPPRLPTLEIIPIADFSIRLFSSEKNASVTSAFNRDYVMIDWGAAFLSEYAQCFPDKMTAAIQTNYGVMALDILKARGGSAYLPEQIMYRDDIQPKLHEVMNAPVFYRSLYAVVHSTLSEHKPVRTIVDTIKKTVSTP